MLCTACSAACPAAACVNERCSWSGNRALPNAVRKPGRRIEEAEKEAVQSPKSQTREPRAPRATRDATPAQSWSPAVQTPPAESLAGRYPGSRTSCTVSFRCRRLRARKSFLPSAAPASAIAWHGGAPQSCRTRPGSSPRRAPAALPLPTAHTGAPGPADKHMRPRLSGPFSAHSSEAAPQEHPTHNTRFRRFSAVAVSAKLALLLNLPNGHPAAS